MHLKSVFYSQQMEPLATVGVICFKDDAVLLVMPGETSQHEEDVLGVPAGKIDPGESERQAAIRELREESGLQVEEDELVELEERYEASIPRRDGTSVLMKWVVFYAPHYKGVLRSSPETTPQWIRIADLKHLTLQGNVLAAIEQAIKVRDLQEQR